jgi:UDP-galactopyranose mutase
MNLDGLTYLVVGSGFFGATIAEKIATVLNEKVLVIEERDYIGGNSHDYIDKETGVFVHKYGSHIFHTKSSEVFEYISKFTKFNNYKHRVFSEYKNKIYAIPINLHTINSFYNVNLKPFEVDSFLKNIIEKDKKFFKENGENVDLDNPKNYEEVAISMLGRELYEAFIAGYTKKQWGMDPKLLSSDIIKRLPFRHNFDNGYFEDRYEGIPVDGYTKVMDTMLQHKNIEVKTNVNYYDIKHLIPSNTKVIFTGSIDKLFDYKYGVLEYRSLDFKMEVKNVRDYLGNAVINYPEIGIPYTRIHEFKHYNKERVDVFKSDKTLIMYEYSKAYKEGDNRYYPINDEKNNKLYEKYRMEATKNPNLIVGGRLGLYKYLDMDKTIEMAMQIFKEKLSN